MVEIIISVAILIASIVTIALGVPASNRYIDRKVRYDLAIIDPAKPIIAPLSASTSIRKNNAELERLPGVA